MSLLWFQASRGSSECHVCGHPLDPNATDWHLWVDDNPHGADNPFAAIHNTLIDCRNAADSARNMRGERSRQDVEDDD